ncbi:hypothetical protein ACH3XX_42340 [Streptomyces scabiei]|uniref:hypothetical protein n=1 Tax=Streptomyces scabiei TaxID=1930 RepID=UPI000765FD20|nr:MULTISPECIES: hypothetical protein [Streptomyces]MBP5915880.1 hypothetical protein [Streptomyces sp. LBUM 1486]MDX3207786.1 hypothetical protein [Streptomyces scabiei]
MTKKPTPSIEARDLRALLTVVLDALTVPNDADDYDQRIDARARIARITIGEALAESPDQLGWNADFLRQRLATEQAEADERAKNRCGRCHQPFDSADLRHDGHGRYASTPWCRSCIDNCRDGSAEHVCRICDPKRYGGGQ